VPEYSLTDPAVLPFIIIPIALTVLLLWGVAAASVRLGEMPRVRRRVLLWTAGVSVGWLALTWIVADKGFLRRWEVTPPPFAILVACIVVLALRIVAGTYGERLARGLPLWTLVAAQSFRLPLETAMHALYEAGIMPVQMSYSGRNFDIITGITALVIAVLVRHGRARALVAAWNVMGLALLLNVMTVAILSTPRLRYFGDDRLNVFVTYPPFSWLPAVMVLAALAGHLLIFRALAQRETARLPR
jgi:hypothetical protein